MLADEPGLGKTVQAIRACDLVFAVEVLVVCPASVVPNWHAEIDRWRLGSWNATVVSYDHMTRNADALLARRWCVVIFDEGHYLKSPGAKRTQKAYGDLIGLVREFDGLADGAAYVWTVTGTPQMNYPNELYSHLKALAPDRIIGPRSGRVWTYEQFQSHFCEMKYGYAGPVVVGGKNEDELAAKLDGFMLRRLKKDVLPELPDVRFSEFVVDADMTDVDFGIDTEELKLLRKAIEQYGVDGLGKVASHIATLRRLTAMAKVKSVLEYIRMFLETSDRKMVVFAQHIDVLDALMRAKSIFDHSVRILGASTQSSRKYAVQRFQTDPKIRLFFGQIQAAGTGLTLTAASDLLFVESSWVPAENAQAAMRIHRIGQKNLCNVRYAVLPKSVDALVMRAVMRKSESIARTLGETL